jgi:hypothetical protein
MTAPVISRIDTAKVTGRRKPQFNSVDEALEDANRLATAERLGRLNQLGNWTLGQALNHIGGWAEFSHAPCPLKTPFLIRLIIWLQKSRFLHGSMPVGVRIPRVEGGTLVTEAVSLDEGQQRFESAFRRLKTEPPTHPSPALGKLTQTEAIALNLRHAELHLSFFVPT